MALSLATGALSGWAVSQHSSAAAAVAAVHEPLSLNAQEMYTAVADADVTITTALLASPQPPLPPLQRYRADIQQAARSLARIQGAGGGNQRLASASPRSPRACPATPATSRRPRACTRWAIR